MKCETSTATIDYEARGEGRPILFLHGWTMNRRLEIADYEPIFASRSGWRRPCLARRIARATCCPRRRLAGAHREIRAIDLSCAETITPRADHKG
jgi:hypothetical protein